jgi:deoxyribonuclease-1
MNILAKILNQVKLYQKEVFLGLCIVLISIISFNLGRINSLQKTPLKITGEANVYQATVGNSITNNKKNTPALPKDLRVVASKASTTKKYHFTWCAGAKQIKESNKIWFETESLAQQAGYTLAGNCQ